MKSSDQEYHVYLHVNKALFLLAISSLSLSHNRSEVGRLRDEPKGFLRERL